MKIVVNGTSEEIADLLRVVQEYSRSDYIKPTSVLVGEISQRMGVKVIEAAPYEPYEVKGSGPAKVLVVED